MSFICCSEMLGCTPPHKLACCWFVCRYTLKFGQVSYYLGYNAMADFFPTWPMRPNPSCTSKECLKLQTKHKVGVVSCCWLPAHASGGDAGVGASQREEVRDQICAGRARGQRVG